MKDAFKSVKEQENKLALAVLPSVLRELDSLDGDSERGLVRCCPAPLADCTELPGSGQRRGLCPSTLAGAVAGRVCREHL